MALEAFCDRAVKVSESRAFTRKEIAAAAGLSLSYINRIFNYDLKTPPSEGVIGRLATALGLDPFELMHLAGRVPAAVKDKLLTEGPWLWKLILHGKLERGWHPG